MTTIACNKQQIACDRQATHNGGLKFKVKSKLVYIDQPLSWPEPFWMGWCGSLEEIPNIISWLVDPKQFKRRPTCKNSEFLALTASGRIYTFSNPSEWIEVDQPYYAIGSGMNYAMAFMATGMTPEEAIKAVCKFDPMSGMGVKKVDL